MLKHQFCSQRQEKDEMKTAKPLDFLKNLSVEKTRYKNQWNQ